jgi:hypothetical protein
MKVCLLSMGSLVLRLPLSFSHFFFRAREYYTRDIEGEGEPGTELWPPWPAMAMVMAATHSVMHNIALALPYGS